MRYMPDCHFNNMVRLPNWQMQEIVIRMLNGETVAGIAAHLRTLGQGVCRQTIWRLRKKYEAYSHVNDLPRSGRPTLLTSQALDMIDTKMQIMTKQQEKNLKNTYKFVVLKCHSEPFSKGENN